MAKVTGKEVATNDIYEGLTPEEVSEMLQMSGQAANISYEKAPILKVNLFSKADKEKRKIEVGNFVLNQSIKIVDGAKVVEDLGEDFGPNPVVTVIKVAKQYNYYNDAKDQRCASQLITEANETPIGYNLKCDCSSGKCPRRQKEIDKKERCTMQYVVYMEVGPEKKEALMYYKGSSFMPFKEYLDSVGSDPILFYPTTLNTKEKTMGSVDYYEVWPEIDKSRPYPPEVRKENLEKLRKVSKGITAYKASQATQSKSKQISYAEAEVVTGGPEEGFDDIAF